MPIYSTCTIGHININMWKGGRVVYSTRNFLSVGKSPVLRLETNISNKKEEENMDVVQLHTLSETDDKMKEEEVVLPGFRFHPTDEELVGFYLKRKVEKKPLRIDLIKQVDIYKYDPWDLPKVNSVGDKEWYFFCKRGRKYRNSIRPNRVTKSGFWKATGIDKVIYSVKEPHHQSIGLKKSLVYYRGSAGKGTKTDWMMHEFRLPPNNPHDANASNDIQEAEVWTLCRIFKRITPYKKYTPNLKDSAADTKPNPETSIDSDNCKSFMQQVEMKPIFGFVDQNKQLLLGQFGSVALPEVPSTLPYPSSWNQNIVEDTIFANQNWDDLRSAIQFANDPSKVYDNFIETYIPPYFS